MDRPDMGVRPGLRGRRPGFPPSPDRQFDGEWSDWMADAPTVPMYLPNFDFAPKPEPERERLPDDAFARLIDRSTRRPPRQQAIPRWLMPLAGSVAAAAVLGVAFFQLRGAPAPHSVSHATEIVVVPASSGGTAVAQCPAERVGNRIQGNGAGGVDSGPAAIFAFQHAYYVARSGTVARSVVAPNASVSTATAIQQGIDSIPAGTSHCVSITPGAFAGQYLVVVTEYRPGAAAFTYHAQAVGTARIDGKTLITGIAPAP
ncbi:hypothetical protein [Nocardia sp. NPDC005366]|uniref:hypothetical protein n=1 Tax=Nocardia sp. NPDC005366 TaxID=3156878 RepID=UPI0033B0D2C1